MWTNDSNPMPSGGGFMDSTMNTSTSSGNAGSSKRGDHCIPVMIGHLNHSNDDLVVWGVPAKLITVVAIVTKIEVLSTKVTFDFKDETGTISGIKWISSDTSYESPVKIHSYARVHGMMRSNSNRNFLLIVKIQPIQELNELISHLMEVTLVSLKGEKMLNFVAKNDQNLTNNNLASIKNEDDHESVQGLNKEQNLVLGIIRKAISEYGAERGEIKTQVPPYMRNKVDEILQFLSAEGHVYTTSTDDHFKHI